MINNSPFLISDRLALFPDSTRVRDGSLFIAGHDLASLADEFGTPLYLYDRATMDASVEVYKSALKAHYPAGSKITHAGKAFLCKAIAQWTQTQNLWIDCTGETEIATALAGNVPRENILVHGVNKSPADLSFAFQYAGTVVIDNLAELRRIESLINSSRPANLPDFWFRLQPVCV